MNVVIRMVYLLFAKSIFGILDFINVCESVGVSFDYKWLEEKCIDKPRGNVLLFQSLELGCLLYLNLFREATNQHEIIEIGIRCRNP